MNITRIVAIFLFSVLLFITLSSCKNNEMPNELDEDIVEQDIINEQSEQDTQTKNDTVSDVDDESIPDDNISSEIQSEETEEPDSIIPENPFASQTLEEFYGNSAFVGDSVMYGLEIYSRRKKTAQSNATFLTLASFAARHALSEVNEASYHPTYNGEKMKVEDALLLDETKNVFLFLGLNDVRVTPNEYFDNYVKLINCIKEKSPDINVFVITTTYPIESPHSMDKPTAASYRDQLKDLNEKLYAYCIESGDYYIDVMTPLINEKGFLDDSYTSDRYVHLTNSAYDIWTKILDEYAYSLIETGLPPVQFEEIPVQDNNDIQQNIPETSETVDTTQTDLIAEEV